MNKHNILLSDISCGGSCDCAAMTTLNGECFITESNTIDISDTNVIKVEGNIGLYKLKSFGKDEIEKVKCINYGYNHLVLLTSLNNIYTMGWNFYHKCSMLLSEKIRIKSPYLLDKKQELGINNNCYVEAVYAASAVTLIIVNPIKQIRLY